MTKQQAREIIDITIDADKNRQGNDTLANRVGYSILYIEHFSKIANS